MATFLFLIRPRYPQAVEVAERAIRLLEDSGHTAVAMPEMVDIDQGSWNYQGQTVQVDEDDSALEGLDIKELPSKENEVDLVVSLGGDGTMLRAVHMATEVSAPVLGVNLGTLGYLPEIEPDELETALKRFLSGNYGIEQRILVEVDEPSTSTSVLALNEIVVGKSSPGHTVRVALEINGQPFLTYVADGVLVSTPTGTTGYNLSIRGPILSPGLQSLVIAPIAPHMLFDRSMVLAPSDQVSLRVLDGREAVLVVDGVAIANIEPNQEVSCRIARKRAELITFGERNFYSILKSKFGLSDR
ncbi:MAG: NAD(+)/NADH kinase [Actinobacteria bacterium]|jgi:NAD+ kinase|nr:NAD(+)/NADH kinase [Actinomycetota bacterium]MCL6095195.1 NAD(+)/NADH kinase [Actinomycetota bacterium]